MAQPPIPKRIHYCWLSDDAMPDNLVGCMETWRRVLPDYEVVRWDARRFDMGSNTFVRQAFERGKWAFASDYIRLHAVWSEGGIYFDSDILVRKSIDDFLRHEMFIPVEYHPGIAASEGAVDLLDEAKRPLRRGTNIPGIGLQAAVFGARAGHPFLRACMDFYEGRDFVQPDGSLFIDPIAPGIYAQTAEAFGFVYDDRAQHLDGNVTVVPSRFFASSPGLATREAYAVHCCNGSWRENAALSFPRRAARKLKHGLARLGVTRGQRRP